MDPDVIARIQAGVASMKEGEATTDRVVELLMEMCDRLTRVEDRQVTLAAHLREVREMVRFLQQVEPPSPVHIDMSEASEDIDESLRSLSVAQLLARELHGTTATYGDALRRLATK